MARESLDLKNPDVERYNSEVIMLGGSGGGEIPRRGGDNETGIAERYAPVRLEFSAAHDPVLMAGCAFWRDSVIETFDPNLITFKNAEDKESIKRIFEIVNSKTFKDFFLEYAPIHLGVYGRCFGELVMNKPWTNLNAVVCVRPHEMDYFRRDVGGIPYYDQVNGEEEGFVQSAVQHGEKYGEDEYFQNVDTMFKFNGDKKDESDLNTLEIRKYTQKEEKELGLMLCLNWNKINRGDFGYGFIEPCYDDVTIKANQEYSKGQTSYRMGNPCPIIVYGSELHKPDEKMDTKARGIAKELASPKTDYSAMPYFYKPSTMAELMGKGAFTTINDDLKYDNSMICASLGIPLEILLQTGMNNPEKLLPFVEIRLKSMQKKLRIEDFLNFIMVLEGSKQRVTLPWRELTMTGAKERVMQIFRLGKAKLLNFKNEPLANKWVMKQAGLPYVEQNYQDIQRIPPLPDNKDPKVQPQA